MNDQDQAMMSTNVSSGGLIKRFRFENITGHILTSGTLCVDAD